MAAVKEEEEKDKKPVKKKLRPIVRLASLLVSHCVFVSAVCCIAGLIALLLLPVLAKSTYISENALLPGSANSMFSPQHVQEAKRFVKDILAVSNAEEGRNLKIPKLIEKYMVDMGAEAYQHRFNADSPRFHALHFFSCGPSTSTLETNNSCPSFGVSSVGIIRAPRGDGKEAIVLVTPYNSDNIQLPEALSLGLAYSVFFFLGRVTWLAKDIVWLAADSQHGEYTAVSSWLKDYHNPIFFSNSGELDSGRCSQMNKHHQQEIKSNVFKRSGTIAAALVFKVSENKERSERDRLDIFAEASNGQMPNLDLINTVHYLAVHRQGLKVMVGAIRNLLESECLKLVGKIVQRLGKVAKAINPSWKFEISASEFVEGTSTLASSIFQQALGVPTGSHGAFRDYQVDAITLELSPGKYLHNDINAQSAFLLRGGRLIEGVVRCVNNLLEKFHQSFFLYFLTAPNKFVSVGVYMIPFALLVAPLPIVAAALFSANKRNGFNLAETSDKVVEGDGKSDSWKWIHAAKVVFMIHLWAGIVLLLPYYITQFAGMTSTTSMLLWFALSISTLLILYNIMGSPYSSFRECKWEILKAVMIAAACIGLSLMSIINFSTAQIGAMFLVPMCLMVQPLRSRVPSALSLRYIIVICNLAFGVMGFLPVGLMILKGLVEGFGRVSIGDFWDWAEFLWSWNSATYLYLLLVHLPCWVLCVHILMHP